MDDVGWVLAPPKRPDENAGAACDVAVPPKLKADDAVAVFVVPNNEPPPKLEPVEVPNAGADDAVVPNAGAVPKAGAEVDVAPNAGAAWPNAWVVFEPNAGAACCVVPKDVPVCSPPKGVAVPKADVLFVAPKALVEPNAGAGA